MHILPPTIRTTFSPSYLPRRPMIRISVTPHELHMFVRQLERDASAAEAAGDYGTAETLSWRAAAMREAGR